MPDKGAWNRVEAGRIVMQTAMDVFGSDDPFALFARWFADASEHEPEDPNAMCLATVDADGAPSARMVLMKDYDPRGFVFYTNLESRKGLALAAETRVALLFHWKSLRRQVRIEGPASPVTPDEADSYYASRGRVSRLGAHASDQSRPLADRATLETRVAEADRVYPGETIPRPAHWSGFRVAPVALEFWQDMPHRLHDRVLFERTDNGWQTSRLYP
jgi:pyridoxamine 5'-phosphate oxidase